MSTSGRNQAQQNSQSCPTDRLNGGYPEPGATVPAHLPCRRSRVRVPSSALSEAPAKGLFLCPKTATPEALRQGLGRDCTLRAQQSVRRGRVPPDGPNRQRRPLPLPRFITPNWRLSMSGFCKEGKGRVRTARCRAGFWRPPFPSPLGRTGGSSGPARRDAVFLA